MKKGTKAILAGAMALTMGASLAAAVGCGYEPITVGEARKIVVGITEYKPMDYKDENGNWVGFDYELSKSVLESLGFTVEYRVIDWDTKTVTLNAQEIDVIWNGMTITEDLQKNLLLSDPYLINRQYGVVKAADREKYTDAESLKDAAVAVETGSAAQGLMMNEDESTNCKTLNRASNQNSAVMEVAAGTSDVAIVDYLLAISLTTGENSAYKDTLVAVDLGFAAEGFAVGFRKKDVGFCTAVNDKIKALYADGTVAALAAKYGIAGQLVQA